MNAMPPRPANSGAGRPAASGVSVEAPRPVGAPLPAAAAAADARPAAPPPDRVSPSPAAIADPEPHRRAQLLPWLAAAVAVLLAAGGGAYAWLRTGGQAQVLAFAPSQAEPLSPGEFHLSNSEMRALRIEEVHPREFRAERISEGRIAYNEDRSTPVFSPYSGRVVRALARLGDVISAGGTLLEIETNDLTGATNDLLSALDAANKARSTLEQALREEGRQTNLFSARAASQRDVEQARVASANAAADLRSSEAALAAARDKLRVLGRTFEQVRMIEVTRQVDAVVPVVTTKSSCYAQPAAFRRRIAAPPAGTTASTCRVAWMIRTC